MSIVRIGLGENKKFAAGYDAIFGGKKKAAQESTSAKPRTTKATKTKAKTAKAKKKTTKKK